MSIFSGKWLGEGQKFHTSRIFFGSSTHTPQESSKYKVKGESIIRKCSRDSRISPFKNMHNENDRFNNLTSNITTFAGGFTYICIRTILINFSQRNVAYASSEINLMVSDYRRKLIICTSLASYSALINTCYNYIYYNPLYKNKINTTYTVSSF